MKVSDINKVKPAKENVIIKVVEPNTEDKLFFVTPSKPDPKNALLSFGEVISTGPNADIPTECPGLTAGDIVGFNSFAGSHVVTNDVDGLYKIMGGYSIMAKIDDINNLNEDAVTPTANRLLLAVKFVDQDDTGLVLLANEASDPRLEDLDYGVILKVGPSCKLGYKVGDIVAYQPYAGENIRQAESKEMPALRLLIEEDVLLTI